MYCMCASVCVLLVAFIANASRQSTVSWMRTCIAGHSRSACSIHLVHIIIVFVIVLLHYTHWIAYRCIILHAHQHHTDRHTLRCWVFVGKMHKVPTTSSSIGGFMAHTMKQIHSHCFVMTHTLFPFIMLQSRGAHTHKYTHIHESTTDAFIYFCLFSRTTHKLSMCSMYIVSNMDMTNTHRADWHGIYIFFFLIILHT